MARYWFVASKAKMPLSVKSNRYYNLAIVECDREPRNIAAGELVEVERRIHVGDTPRSYGYRRWHEMRQRVEALNHE